MKGFKLQYCHVSSNMYIHIDVVKLSHTITFVKSLLLNKLMNSLNNNQDSITTVTTKIMMVV